MTWLTPLTGALILAATVPPLVALYFLKLRRSPRPIASTLLWKRSLEDLRANAPFQRLRMNILLFLQLAVLALLALALAQPQVEGGLKRGGRTVLLIDNSASMNATDGSDDPATPKTRLEVAKEKASAKVEQLFGGGLFAGGGGEVMVVAFADRAEVACPFTESRNQILDAIRGIKPTDGRTQIGDALELARAFTLSTDPDKQDPTSIEPAALELFSDGRIEDLEAQVLKTGETIRYNRIGSPEADNAGVVAIAAERAPEAPDRIQVFAAVANQNPEPLQLEVQLSVDGAARAITPEPITVAGATDATAASSAATSGTGGNAGATAGSGTSPTGATRDRYAPGREQVVFLPFQQPRDAIIEVAQLRKDDLAVDDAAALIVPPAKRLRVALVGSTGFVLRSLLEGMPLEALSILSVEEFEQLIDEHATERFDVYALEGYTPSEGRELPPGRYLSFGGTPVADLNPYGTHERVVIRTSRDEHPIFRFVTLDDLFVSKAIAVQPSREFEVLAEGSNGPIMVALDRRGIRLLYVAFDPLDSNWPFLRSFVNFVPNALEWLGSAGDALALSGLEPGETASFRVPMSATDLVLTRPDGSEEAVTLREPGAFSYGPIRRVGVYTLSWNEPGRDGRDSRRFAVNLLSAAEGRIRPAESLALGADTYRGVSASGTARSSLWPFALGAAMLLLLAEWWVYQRRAG